jgi:hypothetical protein
MAVEPEQGGVRRILSVRAGLNARQDQVAPLHTALRKQAERCAVNWPDALPFNASAEPGGSAFASLTNAAFEHARMLPRRQDERMQVFAEGVQAVVDVWPQAGRAAIGILDAVVKQVDTDTACLIWPVLLELRARV